MSQEQCVLRDRYVLGALIGRGGMAEVYQAHDTVLRRDVAVKLVRESIDQPDDLERFRAEARLLASFDHPFLVTVLDAGVEDEHPWLAMELIEGPTLGQVLTQGPVEPERAAGYGAGLAAALAHVHSRGVVHRDVKPANVLLTVDHEPRLADFGIARVLGDEAGLTRTGHTIGTAAYLAPEQIRGEPVSGASDVYALGLLLLEALTGTRAYPGGTTESALARLHHGPLIPTSLGAPWTGLLVAMTAAAPEARPSAAKVAAILGAGDTVVDDGTSTRAVPVVPAASDSGSASGGSPSTRRGAWVAVAAMAALLLIVAAVGLGSRPGGSPAVAASRDAPAPSASPSTSHSPRAQDVTSTAPITSVSPTATLRPPAATTAAPAPQAATHRAHRVRHHHGAHRRAHHGRRHHSKPHPHEGGKSKPKH